MTKSRSDFTETTGPNMVFGAVVSGLALGGLMGLVDFITNTGGFLRRSDNIDLPPLFTLFNKKDNKKKRRKKINFKNLNKTQTVYYDLLQDLNDYGEYDYEDPEYYYYDDDYVYEDYTIPYQTNFSKFQPQTTPSTIPPPVTYKNHYSYDKSHVSHKYSSPNSEYRPDHQQQYYQQQYQQQHQVKAIINFP